MWEDQILLWAAVWTIGELGHVMQREEDGADQTVSYEPVPTNDEPELWPVPDYLV